MLKALQGRIGRKSYWVGTAFVLLLVCLLSLILAPSEIKPVLSGNLSGLPDNSKLVGIAAAGLWLFAVVNAKRLHDRDRSAWWLVAPATLLASTAVALLWGASGPVSVVCAAIALIMFPITLWLMVEAGFRAGTPGPNRFGPNP